MAPAPKHPALFDTTDCRRQFLRVVAQQGPGKQLLSATAAMAWLQIRPTAFYRWRNALGIVPLVKRNHQALYRRQDLRRIHAAYVAHTRAREVPHDGD